MGEDDFALSLRQLDRWFAGKLATRPRPSVCRVLEAEFGYSVDLLLAPEIVHGDAPDGHSSGRVRRPLRTTDFVAWLADHSGQPFPDVYEAVAETVERLDAEPHGRRAAAEHAKASCTRAQLAAAVQSYYDGSAGFYTAVVDSTALSLSMLVHPSWVGLKVPLDEHHQRFSLSRKGEQAVLRLTPLAVQAAVARLASIEVSDTILVDNPLYRLSGLGLGPDTVGGEFSLTAFAAYALTSDLLEGELVAAITRGNEDAPLALPLRDLHLPSRTVARNFRERLCAGGPACLLAIARPNDYLLLVQKRSGRVVNAAGRLAVIPKAFHQPLTDERETSLSATVDRELEEELLGRQDLEQLTADDPRRLAPRHPRALSEPMSWLACHPLVYSSYCTAFGINMISGNYEFACLAVIDDPVWWDTFGDRVQANWEASRVASYSSRDTEGLAQLSTNPNWSNEGLFAFLEGLRALDEHDPARTAIPAITLTS